MLANNATRRALVQKSAFSRVAFVPKAVLKAKVPAKKAAQKPPAAKKPAIQFGFTKENELFLGRAAMIGFSSSLIGEILTGKGALAQLGYELFDDKLGLLEVDELVIGLIVFNVLFALLPASGTFVPDEEVESRPEGALQNPKISILEPKKFFGITNFGFTKENELFVGRVAQLGFAASLIGETYTGNGPLAQFDIETGISLLDTEFFLGVLILFFLFAAINPGSGKFVNEK